jgi:hypothetical protein
MRGGAIQRRFSGAAWREHRQNQIETKIWKMLAFSL